MAVAIIIKSFGMLFTKRKPPILLAKEAKK